MAELAVSQQPSVPGYRVTEFDVQCSVDPERVCPAKEHLVAMYVGNAGQEGVTEDMSQVDKAILLGKLAEYGLYAARADYDEAQGCPTRTVMDRQPQRVAVVHGIRKVKDILGIRKGK